MKATDSIKLRSGQLSESDKQVSNADFIELVQRSYGSYVAKCYAYVKDKALAQDVVQEGILTAHSKLSSLRDAKSLGAWINRIIVRKAIDQLRRNQKLPQAEDDLDELLSYNAHGLLLEPVWATISNPEEEILKVEGLKQVKSAMEMLEDTYRIPVLLKDFEGFSISEISELLEISESNVKVRVHRGRIKLRSKLSDYFFHTE